MTKRSFSCSFYNCLNTVTIHSLYTHHLFHNIPIPLVVGLCPSKRYVQVLTSQYRRTWHYLEKGTFVDIIKDLKVTLSLIYDKCSYKKKVKTHKRYRGLMAVPRIANSCQNLRKWRHKTTDSSSEHSEEVSPTNNLLWDLWLPELCDTYNFCCFKDTTLVIICYGCPRRVIYSWSSFLWVILFF